MIRERKGDSDNCIPFFSADEGSACMNGYEMMACAHEKMLTEDLPEFSKKDILQHIEALKLVSDKSMEDIDNIFDTGAFTDIWKAYCLAAMDDLDYDCDQRDALMKKLDFLFGSMSAKTVYEQYNK